MLSTVVLGALTLLPGIPVALLVGRGGSRTWSAVLVEALLLGIAWYLLLALLLTHLGWYGRWQVAMPTLALAGALAAPASREARHVHRPVRTWFGALMVVITVVAMALRVEPFYFLYQIGDFGEYVNRGNILADGGGFIGWFTQGFSVALSLAHLALGEAHMVDLMPFLGIVLLLATVALAHRLGASPWARVVVAVVMAVGVVPVWFSRFPASESLYAVLQLGMILLVVEAVQRGSNRLATAAGVLCGLMLVVRGNGLLLGPIVVGALLVGALVVRRRVVVVLSTFMVSAMASLAAAFIFNARFSYQYFIEFQLPRYVPDFAFDQLEGMGGLRFAAPRVVALVVGCAALVWLARLVNDRFGPSNDAPALVWIRRLLLPGVVALALLALVTMFDSAGLTDALARYDVTVELLGAIGLGVALWRFAGTSDDDERVGVILIVLAGTTFAVLFADRIPQPRYAPYYLYWDRYLFSELFPVMVLAAIWALWLLERGLGRAKIPAATIGVAALALGVVLYRDGDLTRQHRFMGDAYADLAAVAELTPDSSVPIVFSGLPREQVPPELYHPNTHRVIGLPLHQTFGRTFLNIGVAPYARDPRPTVDEIARALVERGIPTAYLLQIGAGTDVPAPVDGGSLLAVASVGRAVVDIPMLDRPVDGSPSRWRDARLNVVVSTVALK